MRRAALAALILLQALGCVAAPALAQAMSRERFEAGVAELTARLEVIARQARGVHGANYIAEVETRPTGDYIAIIVKALANDPQSSEVCDAVRQHFLERLTGARGGVALPEASRRLMQEIFMDGPGDAAAPSAAARDLAAKVSLTVALSWRRCAGWLSDWHAVN